MAQCVQFNANRLRDVCVVKFLWVVSVGDDVLIVDLVLDANVPKLLLSVCYFFLLLVCQDE